MLRKRIYSIQMPGALILDLDSTLLNVYGKQEGRAFNYHYHAEGYHPLVCYDGIIEDLLKIQLRDYSGSVVKTNLNQFLSELIGCVAIFPEYSLYIPNDTSSEV